MKHRRRPWPSASLALVAFASNSLLCRASLGDGAIDPASFTAIRLVSGAVVLLFLCVPRGGAGVVRNASWIDGLLLFLYAGPFSYGYLTLETGTGALLLFSSVQMTMFAAAFWQGEVVVARQWAGLAVAASGLLVLLRPGLVAPDPAGAVLMILAGAAWGFYSLRGRRAAVPLEATAGNFALALPLALALLWSESAHLFVSASGFVLALTSGALASGFGYAIWYAAVARLRTADAAVLQLGVPVLAAFGGIAFLGESPTPRLVISAGLVGVGVFLSLAPAFGAQRVTGSPRRTRNPCLERCG